MRKVKKRKKSKLLLKNFLILFFAIFLFSTGAFFLWVSTLQIPSISTFDIRKVAESTKIYARDGKTVLFDVHKDIRRTHVSLDKISRHIKNATIAIEDTEFYNHKGIRPKAILRAVFVNTLYGGYKQGGSTITQQVIKNALLTKEKTISRKIKEWILAIKLERKFNKDQILEMYLNEAPYGGNILGVEEASKRYFNKNASDVTLAEAAYLAALPKAPSYYSPYGKHKDALEDRKNLVLYEMYRNKFITQDEYKNALNEKVEFQKVADQNIKAPHFVFYVIDKLVKEFGEEAVYTGGLKVVTTLDYDLQEKLQEIVKKYALQNEKKFNAENAALVAIDPKTGQIISMVGSRDYFDKKIDGKFNVAVAKRQPGSTFKPIVYVRAFEKGLTPSTVLFDVPTQFSSSCPVNNFTVGSGCYAPKNYDFKYLGPMSMRDALAQSRNIPAVKTLYLVGVKDALNFAHKLGIKSLNEKGDRYGLSLVLGGGEVQPLEITNAYATFANDGLYHNTTPFLSVKDASGNILFKYKNNEKRVIDTRAVRQLNDVLSDPVAREPAYGRNSFYFKGQKVAVKTGTTNDYKDVWIIGYTPKIVIGTWAGNNDNSPIVKKVAGYVIAPLWKAAMLEALKKYPGGKFQKPEKKISTKDILNGVWYHIDMNPPVHSILYWIDKDDFTGPPPSNPAKDPLYPHFEYAVQNWFLGNKNSLPLPSAPAQNDEFQQDNPRHRTNTSFNSNTQSKKIFRITNPPNNARVKAKQPLSVSVRFNGMDIKKVKYYLNGSYLGMVSGAPFSIIIVPQASEGTQTLRAVGIGAGNEEYFTEVKFTSY